MEKKKKRMIGFKDFSRFKSIDEVRITFTGYGCNEMELTYNDKEYFIASGFNNWKYSIFSIALNHQNKNSIAYNTLDELLDNYKVDGKPLQEFILEMNVEYIHGADPKTE
jgi:hypothetical protein